MSSPTKNQNEADAFDAKLFALIWRATAATADKSWTKEERHAWDVIRMRLAEARPFVRDMMHSDQRKKTDLPI